VLAAQLGGVAGAAAAAREAGRRWGDAMPEVALAPAASSAAAMDALTAALDGLGFAPEPRPSEREIVLRACPFEAVAREHRAVVCGVHLGLVERTAAAIGGGLVVEGLDPFRSEDPLACAVRLGSQS
jgi:predicted ArsR family transcriptional regulator